MQTTITKKSGFNSERIQFVKEFKKPIIWAVSGIVALIGFFVWKDIKSRPADPTAEANKISNNKQHQRWALDLANNLGYAHGWYSPLRWFEWDKKVYETLSKMTSQDFSQVSKLYFEVYAKGRDLKADIARVLDSDLYAKVTIF